MIDLLSKTKSKALQSLSPDPGSSLSSICSIAVYKFLTKIFSDSDHISIYSQHLSQFGGFFCVHVLSKFNHLAAVCNKLSKLQLSLTPLGITVKQEFYYMPNGLTYKIHILRNIRGRCKNVLRNILLKKFKE